MKIVRASLPTAIATMVLLLTAVGIRIVEADVFQLSGTVTNQSGNPFAGASVEVLNPGSSSVVASTTTDSNGSYALLVDGGTYDVRVTPPAGSGYQVALALSRTLTTNTTLDFVLIPAGSASLSGRLLDRLGNGVPGQTIYLMPSFVASSTTDSNGAFSFQVAAGDYHLLLDNYTNAINVPGHYILVTNTFSLSQSTIADITLPIQRVAVRVQDADGNAVPNASISCSTQGTSPTLTIGPFTGTGDSNYGLGGGLSAITDSAGDATMWLVPNPSYRFTVTPPSGTPLAVTVFEGQDISSDTSLTFTLAPPVILSGRILDRFGNGVPGQTIYLMPSFVASSTTDSNGAFSFQVAAGDYHLLLDNYTNAINVPGHYILVTNTFSLSQSTIADITLPIQRVAVRVQDTDGNAVPNASISCSTQGTSPALTIGPFTGTGDSNYGLGGGLSAITDSAGDATMWLVPNPSYRFTVTPPSGTPLAVTVFEGQDISSDTSLTFTLAPPLILSGRILDRFGNGVPGQTIYLMPSFVASALTDSNGAFSFQVAAGDYHLLLDNYTNAINVPGHYILVTNTFSLSQDTIADITLPIQRVTVRVQDPGGNAVTNASISCSTQGTSPALTIGPFTGIGDSNYGLGGGLSAITDSAGDATLWLVPNPAYRFTVTPPSGTPFGVFDVSNISIDSDKDSVFVLQFIHDPPVTTASVSPSPDVDGLYSDPVTVTLSAAAFPGFTIAATYYTVDGGATQTYTVPFSVSGSGPHTIRYWSSDNAGVVESPKTLIVTLISNQLSALGPAGVWIGLKNSDDVGTKFDLLAEVLKNGSVVGSGQLNNVARGSSGFNNAVLRTINMAIASPVSVGAGDTLSFRLSVRIAVGVSGHRSGTARLWFNDAAANSRFNAVIGGIASDNFLGTGFVLSGSAGPGPKQTVDVFVDRAVGGNPFKPFGTWSRSF